MQRKAPTRAAKDGILRNFVTLDRLQIALKDHYSAGTGSQSRSRCRESLWMDYPDRLSLITILTFVNFEEVY
jgi:hypothetical protein